jgi:hypothetical protein
LELLVAGVGCVLDRPDHAARDGVVSWLEVVGAVLLVVFMVLVMVIVVVPLWRSALRDLGRWTRPPPEE